MPSKHCNDAAKAPFNGLNGHLSNQITRKPTTRPCSPGHDLSVTAVFDDGVGHHLAGIIRNLEPISAPAVVTVIDCPLALQLSPMEQQACRPWWCR